MTADRFVALRYPSSCILVQDSKTIVQEILKIKELKYFNSLKDKETAGKAI